MTEQRINVHCLPSEVGESELAGSAVAVIDVLRATSTICQALASGAREVVPFVEIDDARAAAERVGRANVVLGGERMGLLIDGFDLGNSPAEYSASRVGGRAVYITTTNGTRALQHARLAKSIVTASFLNVSAVVASLKDEPRVDILCAGTDGRETDEDILLAGAIVFETQRIMGGHSIVNELAQGVRDEWDILKLLAEREGRTLIEQLSLELRDTLGGRNCIEVGNGADIPYCSQVDLLNVLPRLNLREWKITAS
jgi:2-phosphosulfolactate phosphatase